MQKQWRRAVLHGVFVVLLVTAVYAAVSKTAGTVVYLDETVRRAGLTSWRTGLITLGAAGHTVLSGNFMFALPSLAKRLASLSAGRMLHEEIFMGGHAPAFVRHLAPWTAGGAAVLVILAWMKSASNAFRARRRPDLPNAVLPMAAAVWLIGSAVLALYFEPSNPEMWLLALPPFWLLVGHGFSGYEKKTASVGCRILAWAVVIGLLIHNAIGGMALVRSAEGDYALQKVAAVAGYATADDWVLTADSHSTITCLQYYTLAEVVDGRFIDVAKWNRMIERSAPRRVWILREFFEPPPGIRNRPRQFEAQREALAERLRLRAEPVGPATDAAIYRWTPPEPPASNKLRLGT